MLNSLATFTAVMAQRGTWTPESDPRFREVFWRPPPTPRDYGFHNDSTILQHTNDDVNVFPNPTIWLNLESFSFAIIDDPMEAWLCVVRPFWSDRMAVDKAMREKLSFCMKVSDRASERVTRRDATRSEGNIDCYDSSRFAPRGSGQPL